MKNSIPVGYRADLADLAECLNDLMADLEDVRDEAMETADAGDNPALRRDLQRIDQALKLLSDAADLLEDDP